MLQTVFSQILKCCKKHFCQYYLQWFSTSRVLESDVKNSLQLIIQNQFYLLQKMKLGIFKF